MKHKPIFSFYRFVFGISVFCLLCFPVGLSLLQGRFAGAPAVLAGVLAACAVLLLLPVADEYVQPSFYFALAQALVCVAGAVLDLPLRCTLAGLLVIHGICLLRRSRAR